MEEFVEWIECIEDTRQQSKIRYTVQEVVLIVFCSELCGVDDWENKQVWAEYNLNYLREYLPYENGVPSHDTMQRVMGMVKTEYFQQAYNEWIEEFEKSQKINMRKIVCIDGKTMRGNKRKGREQKANHIVTAWSREGGYSLGQRTVEEHSNEITAIPKLLDTINIKKSIITIDAMGTQTAIAEKIRKEQGNYVLAVKENQGTLYDEIRLYFEEEKHLKRIRKRKKLPENSRKESWSGRYQGILSDFLCRLDLWERKVDRTQDNRNGSQNLSGCDFPKILYLQSAVRCQSVFRSSQRTLVCRVHALAA